MKVESVSLKNFRNIQQAEYFPDPDRNFLIGQNAQGKTSFLEAISFLSNLRSFRRGKPQDVIQWGANQAEISCVLSSRNSSTGEWRTRLRILFQKDHSSRVKKIAWINEKKISSSTRYLSERFRNYGSGFHTITFNPSDHDLIQGEPKIRRTYLNEVISGEDEEYLKALRVYNRALEQKNSLLRQATKVKTLAPDQIKASTEPFTEQMKEAGSSITFKRLYWLFRLTKKFNKILRQIAPKQLELQVTYASDWLGKIQEFNNNFKHLNLNAFAGQDSLPSLEQIKRSFCSRLLEMEKAEFYSGRSLVGPHRDDWMFLIDHEPLKGHGSQGEIRTALLALKLSEIELFCEKTGYPPIFLLDDLSSELDHTRREFLLRFLDKTDIQVFVTTTENLDFRDNRFLVENGNLKKLEKEDVITNVYRHDNEQNRLYSR